MGHLKQVVAPAAEEVPTGQDVQPTVFALEYVPGAHEAHSRRFDNKESVPGRHFTAQVVERGFGAAKSRGQYEQDMVAGVGA